MEIFVVGDCSVRFLDDDEDEEAVEYSIRKPSSFVKNLVAGTKYIEIVGDLVVSCSNSKAHAVVAFKEGSSWGGVSTRNKVEGRVVDERGVTGIELVGRWDDAVDRKDGKHSFTRLWQIADSPPSASLTPPPCRVFAFRAGLTDSLPTLLWTCCVQTPNATTASRTLPRP